jgi:hypothetical protein
VYHVGSRRRLEFEGVEVLVCMVIRDKGSKVRAVMYVKYVDRVK